MRRLILAAGLLSAALAGSALAQEGRTFEENGVLYREVRRQVRVPAARVEWAERQETVYKQKFVTEVQEFQQPVLVPVTTYHMVPRTYGLLNPFQRPYTAYHCEPHVRWQTCLQTVKAPVNRQIVEPEQRTVRTPSRKLGFVVKEQVERVALGPANRQPAAPSVVRNQPPPPNNASLEPVSVANWPQIGGIRRLDGDPPRYGPAIHSGMLR